MKGHAALPDPQDRERFTQEPPRVVEDHVAEASARDHPERNVEEHIVDVAPAPAAGGVGGAHSTQPPAEAEGHYVHEPVPVDREGSDLDRDGIEFGVLQHCAARSYSQGELGCAPDIISAGCMPTELRGPARCTQSSP